MSNKVGKFSQQGQDLTQGTLWKTLLILALPIMLSNFMQMFYNLTDAFWLGKLGENARNAVSVAGIAFPIVFFLSSFGFGFVIAGTTLISQYKGAGKQEKIKDVVGQFILILSVFSFIYLVLSLFFLEDILHLLRVPAEIFQISKEYIFIILIGTIFMFVFLAYQSFAHGLGDTVSPMKIQMISVGLNVVLDPIFIFGFSFIPRLETTGAAYATLISRIVATILSFYYIKAKIPIIIPKKRNIIPDPTMLKRIMKISIPASLGQSMTSFGFLLLQGFVNSFGTVVISVFSIGNRLNGFFMMPAMGVSNALASIVGQNLGAGKMKRAEQSVKYAMALVIGIMGFGSTLLFFYGAYFTKFFINDPAVVQIGIRMFQVTSIASLEFAVIFVFMGAFNGAGHTRATMLLNVVRLWGLRIPFVLLLSGIGVKYNIYEIFQPIMELFAKPFADTPYDALWVSMVISNFVIAIWAGIIYKKGNWKKATIHD
ncbi:MAG: MATE family efflux transporter [Candidatus Cloacimonetes bacterium]|nr:MATE family efflux transporter [Candidatus Cloacimonadota bacterium]